MTKPSLFEITQSVLALIVVVGMGVMVAAGWVGVDPFVLIVGVVLGFYFGGQSGQNVKALSMALIPARDNPARNGVDITQYGITVAKE